MAQTVGDMSATVLARFARHNLFGIQRAAFRIGYGDDNSVAMALFGNDNYSEDWKVREEVEAIRCKLREAAVQEVGFGLSQDGQTWALLLRVTTEQFQTPLGKAFHIEMVKNFLDDIIQGAWRAAGELSPDSAVWLLKDDRQLD